MLLVVAILPWLLAPSRAPRVASEGGQESFPASRTVSNVPVRQATAQPASGLSPNDAGAPPVAAVPLPEAQPTPADRAWSPAPQQLLPAAPTVSASDTHPPQGASALPTQAHPPPSASALPTEAQPPQGASVPTSKVPPPQGVSVPPAEPPPAATSNPIVVQVGVFSEQTKAHALLKKLEKQGIHAHMEVARFKEGSRVRVRIGPLKTRSELKKLLHQLDQMGIKSMIVTP